MGIQIPLGFADLGFSDPVWQAGIGETVIGVTLLAAGLTARTRLAWLAFWLSALGIAIGLSSQRVQGAARSIHVVMMPLAIIVLVLLVLARRRQPSATRPEGDLG